METLKTEQHPSSLVKVLASWPFLLFLTALLLNDWWLKRAFPGLVTGKLSDFAGIALVGTLAMTIWPSHVFRAAAIIAAGFIWWKGPLSQTAIDGFNRLAPFSIGRTVDYTDLIALCMLAVCPHFSACADRYSCLSQRVRHAVRIPLFATVTFAIMGTSFIPTRETYSVRSTASSVALERRKFADAIAEVMRNRGLECRDCANPAESAEYAGNGMVVTYRFSQTDAVFFEISAYPNGILFGASGAEKAEALRKKLKALLAERFSGLEYVEPLQSRSLPAPAK